MSRKVMPLVVIVLVLSLACNRSLAGSPISIPSVVPEETDVIETAVETQAPTPPPTITASPMPTTQPSATNTALPPSATPSPTVTFTPLPCYLDMEAYDVTIPDGSEINVDTSFLKTWRLTNSGTCNWTADYKVVFTTGNKMGGVSPVKIGAAVASGQQIDVSVDLVAPGTVGPHIGYWQLQKPDGSPVGLLWVEIRAIQPISQQLPTAEPPAPAAIPDWPTLRKGETGAEVYALQYLLIEHGASLTADGVFGNKTADAVVKFQQDNGLTADGIVGAKTWQALIADGTLKKGSNSAAVKGLQILLNQKNGHSATIDGIFGSQTHNAVVDFQESHDLTADGIVGAQTWQALIGE